MCARKCEPPGRAGAAAGAGSARGPHAARQPAPRGSLGVSDRPPVRRSPSPRHYTGPAPAFNAALQVRSRRGGETISPWTTDLFCVLYRSPWRRVQSFADGGRALFGKRL